MVSVIFGDKGTIFSTINTCYISDIEATLQQADKF